MNSVFKKSVVAYEQNYVAFPLFAFSPKKVGSKDPVVVSNMLEIDGEERTVKFELVPTQGIDKKLNAMINNIATAKKIGKLQDDLETHILVTAEAVPSKPDKPRKTNALPGDIFQ